MPIQPIFLVGAGNDAQAENQPNLETMTQAFCEFLAKTHSTLHIAAYHFKFVDAAADRIRQALAEVAERAEVKIAYFDEKPKGGTHNRHAHGGDASGASLFDGYDATKVQLKPIDAIDVNDLPQGVAKAPIEGGGALMHSKYMIRDNQAVWMGSANFTEDGWGLQDNNVLILEDAAELAQYYTTDFDELWQYGRIAGTGKDDTGTVTIDGDSLTVDFSPGDGKAIDQTIAELIDDAQTSLHIASMVISSQAVLQALSKALDRKVALTGVYDGPQMEGVVRDWQHGANSADKLALWNKVKDSLVAKHSKTFNPHQANAFYNFMHNKALVVDGDIVHTGSFNFSGNATRNAENVVNITDADLAGQYVTYIEKLVQLYQNQPAPSPALAG